MLTFACVNIVVRSTSGTTSDGEATLANVAENDVLVSVIAYATKEILVGNKPQ